MLPHPAPYHGQRQRPPFFEGWYFKLISADETRKLAIIPGVFFGPNGHAFVQVLDGCAARSDYITFPLEAFDGVPGQFDLGVSGNRFSEHGLSINLTSPATHIRGQ